MTDSKKNPLHGWQVDRARIRTVGHDLQRPECILAERDGTLWAADARGGGGGGAPGGTPARGAPRGPPPPTARRPW
jgi:hypothetical protein